MKKYLKKQVASVALSMAIAGSSAAAMSTPVYAAEEDANLKQAEQSIDEEAKEENKQEVEETKEEKPYEPEKPTKPEKPSQPDKPSKPGEPVRHTSPQTGDSPFDLALALAGLGGSALALGSMARVRRREYKK